MLDMFRVSREFKMKYRGLLYYYGKDFVAFKKENRDSQGRNLFLEVIASYMTLHLEDEHSPLPESPSFHQRIPPDAESL